MRALCIQDDAPVLSGDLPIPAPTLGDAVVRPLLVLITQPDIHAIQSSQKTHQSPSPVTVPSPIRILGHQFVGIVEDAPDATLIGKRVVGDINITDPQSLHARRGIGHHDPDRRILGLKDYDGCLSERFCIPQRNLSVVPDQIDDERAVFATQLAAAVHVSRIERIEGKAYVTVLGGDLTALLCAQIMGTLNASVRMLTGRSDRLELCAKWGIKHRHLSEVGRRADQDIVIDTMSEPDSLSTALAMARPRGSVILQSNPVSVIDQDSDIGLGPAELSLIIERELKIYGSRCGQVTDGLGALQTGRIDLSGLITKRVKFDDVMSGMRASMEPEHIAVLVQMP